MSMRITQGYVSKSVMDFPFHQIYALDDYKTRSLPSVFFGMYRFEDTHLANVHMDHTTVFWTGQDALDTDYAPHRNVTAHPNVYKKLIADGNDCELVQPSTFLNSVQPQQLGPKIYAYCPSSAPDYHGRKVLEELSRAGYEIHIGDGQVPQHQWKYSQGAYYDDIFVGLCLSEFAGGGTSIIEMGLRGIPVITNVFELRNCYKWDDAQDVANIIEHLKRYIGTTKTELANEVWKSLDHEHNWLEI